MKQYNNTMYVIIVGCGRVGSELAKLLSAEGHNVVIVDKSADSFTRLGKKFNGSTVVGNGFNINLLKEAGVEKADAFCSVTNSDNVNIIASQVAKKIFKVPKVIARIYDPHKASIYKSLGLNVISGTMLFAAMIRDKLIEERFSSYLLESGEFGMFEIEAAANLQGKTVGEINMPSEFIVVSLTRKHKHPIIPDPAVKLELGDKILGVVKTTSLNNVKKNLGLL